MLFRRNALFGVLALLAACGTDNTTDDANDGEAPDFRDGSYFYVLGYDPETGEQIRGGAHAVVGFDESGKTEPIDSSNRVSRFHPDFVTGSPYHTYDATLTQGNTTWDVFASTWWPQSRNGTAQRWQSGASQDYNIHTDRDRLSPTEKYDLLFYPGQTQVVEAVAHCTYEDSVENPDTCEKIEHPQVTALGPTTAWELENQGVYQSVEPDSWWGHCNGWASYATTEPLGYPRRDVRVKLVDGKVTECTTDTTGCVLFRMADMEALMTELYFSDQATFSGRRCNTRPDEIQRDEFGRPTEVACRDLNPGAFHVAIVGMLGRGARNLATGETGGKPAFVIDHNWDHEIWNFPIVAYRIDSQADVSEQEASRLVGATAPDYQWNSAATRFVRVTMTYSMVSDGVPNSQLTMRADLRPIDPVDVELNYVLELDAAGAILGGEWIQDPVVTWGPNNKELHPDFIWMATDPVGFGEGPDDTGGTDDNPYVAYSQAQALLRCANEPGSCAPEGRTGDTIINATDRVARGEMDHYDTGVVEPGRYTITLAHDPAVPGGDADLYVRTNAAPTTSTYECRPYLDGSAETCTVNLTAPGTIFVMVHGYSDASYVLTVEGEGGGGGGGNAWEGLDESGTVTRNQEARYTTPALAAGRYAFEITGSGDADLYVRVGSAPTTTTWDCRPYADGSVERCEVMAGEGQVIHVMVRGYATTSLFELLGFPL